MSLPIRRLRGYLQLLHPPDLPCFPSPDLLAEHACFVFAELIGIQTIHRYRHLNRSRTEPRLRYTNLGTRSAKYGRDRTRIARGGSLDVSGMSSLIELMSISCYGFVLFAPQLACQFNSMVSCLNGGNSIFLPYLSIGQSAPEIVTKGR
jgi:hypothetical protein